MSDEESDELNNTINNINIKNNKKKILPFPSSLELTAASALLLLCDIVPLPLSKEVEKMKEEERERNAASIKVKKTMVTKMKSIVEACHDEDDMKTPSCESTLTMTTTMASFGDEVSAEEYRRRRIHLKKLMARCRDLKLKVAQRSRSKVVYKGTIVDSKRTPTACLALPAAKPFKATTMSDTITESAITTAGSGSCLSSGGSSEISSARKKSSSSSNGRRKRRPEDGDWRRDGGVKRERGVGSSPHIRRRAEAIKRLLSSGLCASEVRIRQILGDSPDTSKALRMLLRMEEVERTGAGGRCDPFVYKIAPDAASSTVF